MSVATELNRIISAKADIKTATADKGVTIPDDKLIDEYADYIDQIQTGTSLVVNSNNLDYFCSDRPDFIPVLDDTEVLTYFEYGGTTYNFDIDMKSCFQECTMFRYDPIKLINKIINLNDKYANIIMTYTFALSVFNYDFGQDSTLYIKSAPNTQTINLSYIFSNTDISNFKDVEIDFTGINSTYTTSLNVDRLFANSISGNNGFKITNLPVSLLSRSTNLGGSNTRRVNLNKLTSDGSELHKDFAIYNLNVSEPVFMEFINSLETNTSGNTVEIIVSSTLNNSLTADDRLVIAAKNYTISYL